MHCPSEYLHLWCLYDAGPGNRTFPSLVFDSRRSQHQHGATPGELSAPESALQVAQLGDILKTESRCYPDVPNELQGSIGDSLMGNVQLGP